MYGQIIYLLRPDPGLNDSKKQEAQTCVKNLTSRLLAASTGKVLENFQNLDSAGLDSEDKIWTCMTLAASFLTVILEAFLPAITPNMQKSDILQNTKSWLFFIGRMSDLVKCSLQLFILHIRHDHRNQV